MAHHYDIFREQLGTKYPSYGHALWDPSPGGLYRPVEVGDVGYIREGKFHRLFNALLPADDPSHSKFGVPEHYEPLVPNTSEHIDTGTLRSNHYCSYGITIANAIPEQLANRPDDLSQVAYRCKKRQCGAVLFLPVRAQRKDTVARRNFGKWIIDHVERWLAFAQDLGRDIVHMEDIILVTGCDLTRSWANVAFLGDHTDAQPEPEVSFGVNVTKRNGSEIIDWRFSPNLSRGAELKLGPDGEGLAEDQCVFVRGFRVTRTLKIFPKHLKAAAGPSSDPDENNSEPELELTSMPPATKLSKYRDPLYVLLEYIAQRMPECNMVLVHDDDLARIDEICSSNETLQSDAVMHLLEKYEPKIQQVQFNGSCDGEYSPKTGTEATTVAMFSEEYQRWGRPESYILREGIHKLKHLLSSTVPTQEGPTTYYHSTANIPPPPYTPLPTSSDSHHPVHLPLPNFGRPDRTTSQSVIAPPIVDVDKDESFAWFVAIDQDGNGQLSPEELRSALLKSSGLSSSEGAVKHLMDTFDLDGDGAIGFEEFVPLWNYVGQWRQIFDSFDIDHDGRIDAAELGQALAFYNLHVGPRILDMLMKKYGMSPRNQRPSNFGVHMDWDDFMCACVVVQQMCKLYERYSVRGPGPGRSQTWRDDFLAAVISLP